MRMFQWLKGAHPHSLAILLLMSGAAQAHDWFEGTIEPITNLPCCSGNTGSTHVDCQPIPAEMSGIIQEMEDGYRVTLTLDQAKFFNDQSTNPVDEVVEYASVQAGLSNGFAMCIYNNHVRCFFVPSNM